MYWHALERFRDFYNSLPCLLFLALTNKTQTRLPPTLPLTTTMTILSIFCCTHESKHSKPLAPTPTPIPKPTTFAELGLTITEHGEVVPTHESGGSDVLTPRANNAGGGAYAADCSGGGGVAGVVGVVRVIETREIEWRRRAMWFLCVLGGLRFDLFCLPVCDMLYWVLGRVFTVM
ncbi:hypothetical protein FB567DRAFT_204090 [Paraphoma chrysanthemicola]|uniref:Uncharacterized protein n=1 Tax=Paraphoma chrysanthemicola TaxID=798071 RepID=A0A8K0QWA5_9PLEO|nr:hypothetical protein FB567DRAFT_204090 [Paraphoma chrysanthemicola]